MEPGSGSSIKKTDWNGLLTGIGNWDLELLMGEY
jgi:hypothetical protein